MCRAFRLCKNIDLLIESWKIVTDRYPDWHLDVWGNGPLKDELQEKLIG